MKVFDEIKIQDEIIDYSQLTFNFGNFMSLGNLAKNIYNGNIS